MFEAKSWSPSYRSTYMKILLTFLVCAFCLSRFSAAQLETITIPLIDKTGAASPFEAGGRFLLEEATHGNQLEWSWGEKVAIKNISSKPVLLFIATITEIGRYPKGQHAAPGDGPTYVIEDDRFFSENLIRPGESLTIRDAKPGTTRVACCIDPLAQRSDPIGQYYLGFVQFADGSTFGDPAEARDALALRETILRGLRELNQAYAEQGEQGFAAMLKEQSPFSATSPFGQIINKYKEGGIGPAIGTTRDMLTTAEKHLAGVEATDAAGNAGPRQ